MAEKTPVRLRYVGPFGSVGVPALRQSVKRNHQITVDDSDVAAALLEQSDWEAVGAKTKKDDASADAPKEG